MDYDAYVPLFSLILVFSLFPVFPSTFPCPVPRSQVAAGRLYAHSLPTSYDAILHHIFKQVGSIFYLSLPSTPSSTRRPHLFLLCRKWKWRPMCLHAWPAYMSPVCRQVKGEALPCNAFHAYPCIPAILRISPDPSVRADPRRRLVQARRGKRFYRRLPSCRTRHISCLSLRE